MNYFAYLTHLQQFMQNICLKSHMQFGHVAGSHTMKKNLQTRKLITSIRLKPRGALFCCMSTKAGISLEYLVEETRESRYD